MARNHRIPRLLLVVLVVLLNISLPKAVSHAARPDGELDVSAVDSETGQGLPVRFELFNARGKGMVLRGTGAGHLGEHFYLPGTTTLPLKRGKYTFAIDAGAEYRTQQGHFTIDRHASDTEQVVMRRFANLANEGWWGGDLDVQRAGHDLPLVAAAEGIHYLANAAWRWDGTSWKPTDEAVRRPVAPDDPWVDGRVLGPTAAIVESPGGSFLLVGETPLARPPLELSAGQTPLEQIRLAKKEGLRVVATTPTAWELPLWIASGELDGVMLLTRQSERTRVDQRDPTGRPRDGKFFPGPRGLGRWGETIYFHLLNAGIRVMPLAGSGSGANTSPVGTNRVYVHCGEQPDFEAWWQGVEEGHVVVTNGPLIRPVVDGAPPGVTFRIEEGASEEFLVGLNLSSRDHVDYLEILKNGEPIIEVRLADWAAQGGKLPGVPFDESGWFAVRAATDNPERYQLALTAPYWVESSRGVRISKASVQFFIDWIAELRALPAGSVGATPDEIDQAEAFWKRQLSISNAD